MVAARQGNVKRKNGNKPGNARKFKAGPGGGNKPRINMRAGIGAMFNPNQMMDNPGYMDFNEPPGRPNNQKHFKNMPNNNNKQNRPMLRQNNQLQRNGQNGPNNSGGGGNNGARWGPPRMNQQSNNMRQGPPRAGPFRSGPMPPRMHPMRPMPPMGMRPPMPPPMPPHMTGRFGPGPIMPPPMGRNMPPMGGPGPLRRPPQFRMGPGGPLPPRGLMQRNPPGQFKRGKGPLKNNPISNAQRPVPNQKNLKNRRKGPQKIGTAVKKTNPNVNKYALDKPWVNDEIREANQKKVDLENQLKGKKNDEIFAEFKIQRDKFVSLYDAARTAHIGKNPTEDKEKKLIESDKSKGDQNTTKAKPNTNTAS